MMKFEVLKTEIVKLSENALIEVALTKGTEDDKLVEFVSLNRSWQDANGRNNKKGSLTCPKKNAIELANAINRVVQ